jgi:hypothetical protein
MVRHPMTSQWLPQLQTMRYRCLVCSRCVEDGPEGLRVVAAGDTDALHSGGNLALDLEADASSGDRGSGRLH